MRITAAIARQPHAPLDLCEAELDGPRDDVVLVRVVACGICPTDLV